MFGGLVYFTKFVFGFGGAQTLWFLAQGDKAPEEIPSLNGRRWHLMEGRSLPSGAASIKCFFASAVRSLAFDRGGQTGPPQ